MPVVGQAACILGCVGVKTSIPEPYWHALRIGNNIQAETLHKDKREVAPGSLEKVVNISAHLANIAPKAVSSLLSPLTNHLATNGPKSLATLGRFEDRETNVDSRCQLVVCQQKCSGRGGESLMGHLTVL